MAVAGRKIFSFSFDSDFRKTVISSRQEWENKNPHELYELFYELIATYVRRNSYVETMC